MAKLDLEFFQKCDGIGRDVIELRIKTLCHEIVRMRANAATLEQNLTNTQVRCTQQEKELREHRRANAWVGTPEASFLLDVLHALPIGRAKHPGNRFVFSGLAEEFGEVAMALNDGESRQRVREECIDTVVCALRLAIEGDAAFEETIT